MYFDHIHSASTNSSQIYLLHLPLPTHSTLIFLLFSPVTTAFRSYVPLPCCVPKCCFLEAIHLIWSIFSVFCKLYRWQLCISMSQEIKLYTLTLFIRVASSVLSSEGRQSNWHHQKLYVLLCLGKWETVNISNVLIYHASNKHLALLGRQVHSLSSTPWLSSWATHALK